MTPEERLKRLDERIAELNRAQAAMRAAMTIPADDEPDAPKPGSKS